MRPPSWGLARHLRRRFDQPLDSEREGRLELELLCKAESPVSNCRARNAKMRHRTGFDCATRSGAKRESARPLDGDRRTRGNRGFGSPHSLGDRDREPMGVRSRSGWTGYLVVGLQDASVIVGLAGGGVPIAVFEVDGGCVGRVPVDVAVAPTVSHNTDGLCSCIVGNAAQRWPSVMCNPPHAGTVQLPH